MNNEALNQDLSGHAADGFAAQERDEAALSRDNAAEVRDVESRGSGEETRAAGDRWFAALDRAAAADDRRQAALDRRRAAEHLLNAYQDELTGAMVRRAGRDQLDRIVDRAHRTTEPLVVAFVDVDHLKRINDVEGHAAGDRLLQEVGSALRGTLRSYDVVVRYGGDEFVCALQGSHRAEAQQRFSEVRDALVRTHPRASVSIGLVELRRHESLDGVIRRADSEMYRLRAARGTGFGRASPTNPLTVIRDVVTLLGSSVTLLLGLSARANARLAPPTTANSRLRVSRGCHPQQCAACGHQCECGKHDPHQRETESGEGQCCASTQDSS